MRTFLMIASIGIALSAAAAGMTAANARANGTRAAVAVARAIGKIDPRAHASVGGSGFEGWPTDYLMNRFGDHQAQGRF